MSGGVILVDYDRDGYSDIYFTNAEASELAGAALPTFEPREISMTAWKSQGTPCREKHHANRESRSEASWVNEKETLSLARRKKKS